MLRLVIGNKNYSTWSLRPWFLMRYFDIPFEEVNVSLRADGLTERLRAHSPSARVPVLLDGEVCIWDSLAICEWLSQRRLGGRIWPEDPSRLALARSLVCEMHAGFGALRSELPMNIRAHGRHVTLSVAAQHDLDRIRQIWETCGRQYAAEGGWLMGAFSIVDAFYAPVALRLPTYGVDAGAGARWFVEAIRANEHIRDWVSSALEETEILPEDEAGA